MAYNNLNSAPKLKCDFSALEMRVNAMRPSMKEGDYIIIGTEQVATPKRVFDAFTTTSGNYIELSQFDRTPEIIEYLKHAMKEGVPFRVHVTTKVGMRCDDGITRHVTRYVVDHIY